MKIVQSVFGTMADGREVSRYTVTNGTGYELRCMDYGATIVGFRAPDREGRDAEVALCYDELDRYLEGHPFFGSTVGRVANRISGASFTLNGTTYELEPNEGRNLLHSGPNGFHARLWEAQTFERANQAGVIFHLVSPEGDQGFPGELAVSVSLSLTSENELVIEYHAESNAPTPVNLTNHTYWNLAGAPDRRRFRGEPVPAPEPRGGAIGEHEVTLYAREYLEVDDELLPTGRILSAQGGPFDFTGAKPVGRDLAAAGGYDHCYVLYPQTDAATSGGAGSTAGDQADAGDAAANLRRAAVVRDPSSGRKMEVLTTSPALQFYSGNMLPGEIDQFGNEFQKHDAMCLETQFHPDAVNHDNFPSVILRPGETFQHKTVHRFGVE